MEGYISYHMRMCSIPGYDCYCKRMPDRKPLSITEKQIVYYTFLVDSLKSCLIRIMNVKLIHKLISNIYEHRLKNRFQAIYEITKVNSDGDFVDRLDYYNAIKVIEN